MTKNKSKERPKILIKPAQLRDALVLTGREYIKTPKYKEKAKQQLMAMIKQIKPDIERFQYFADQANQRIASLGISQMMKQLQEEYSHLLKNYAPKTIKAFDFPINYSHASLTDEDIDVISEKSAEKVFTKIQENKFKKRPNKNNLIPFDIIPGIAWENIKIQIINENNVLVLVSNRKHQTNFKKMGFEDSRTGKPNKQWMLLWFLSVNNGSIAWEDYKRNHHFQNISLNDINKFKKTKQLLSETLKNYFKINDDPFYSYKKEGAYRIKINLIGELPR